MLVFIIKDWDQYHPAGIIADVQKKYVPEMFEKGIIANPKQSAKFHAKKWELGAYREAISTEGRNPDVIDKPQSKPKKTVTPKSKTPKNTKSNPVKSNLKH
jgi:hypothetical protein